MSIANEFLSFRDGHHKYQASDDHHGRRIWRNGLGWEIRHVTPNTALSGSSGRRVRIWRYDIHDPAGRFIASEPTFWEASRTFAAAYCGGPR